MLFSHAAERKKKKKTRHHKKNQKLADTLVLDDPAAWTKAWGSLAADVAADPVLKNWVMFDLLNEPDSRGITWRCVCVFEREKEWRERENDTRKVKKRREIQNSPFFFSHPLLRLFLKPHPTHPPFSSLLKKKTKNLTPSIPNAKRSGPGKGGYGMDALYEMAGDAVYAANPSALMLFEGTGQLGTVAMNWGDGFATDPAVVTAGGVQSAQPFFNMVLSKPWAANVVISPHLYPPSVSTHRELDQVTGSGLFARLSNSFGYLTKKGVCSTVTPSKCRTYPIVFGETGSKFTDELDLKMLQDFATYMRSEDALHVPILNMFWWSFNANSGDTGTCAREREGGREREREREKGEKRKNGFFLFVFF